MKSGWYLNKEDNWLGCFVRTAHKEMKFIVMNLDSYRSSVTPPMNRWDDDWKPSEHKNGRPVPPEGFVELDSIEFHCKITEEFVFQRV